MATFTIKVIKSSMGSKLPDVNTGKIVDYRVESEAFGVFDGQHLLQGFTARQEAEEFKKTLEKAAAKAGKTDEMLGVYDPEGRNYK